MFKKKQNVKMKFKKLINTEHLEKYINSINAKQIVIINSTCVAKISLESKQKG